MSLEKSIDNLLLGNDLHKNEVSHFFTRILSGKEQENAETALALLYKKIETAYELAELVKIARNKTSRLSIETNKDFQSLHHLLADGCGTGGDAKRTFNISTLACLVAASAGAYIAKHGNRSITSKCGSSDFIEGLGIKLKQTPKQMLRSLEEAHFVYFHAPYFTHAFQNVLGIRKSLSCNRMRSVFNLAGPLLNPARVEKQVIGVFHERYLKVLTDALKQLGTKRALIFIGSDGTDELTTHTSNLIVELRMGKVRHYSLNGADLGLRKSKVSDLKGGAPSLNHKIALNILKGKDRSAKRDVICLNAAAILYVSGIAESLKEGVSLAKSALDSGCTYGILLKLRQISNDSR